MGMMLYVGWKRETEITCEPVDLGCGAARIACVECDGSGVWAFMAPEVPAEPCVACKGTGAVLVGVA